MTTNTRGSTERGEQAEKKLKPVNFRPVKRDRENIDKVRADRPWVTSDADAIRYALEKAARGRRA